MKGNITFEDVYKQNKRRIYYHIHQLNLKDPHQEFFQIGLTSLWQAYKTYQPDKGSMSTYFNYIIRNRLIDQLRKQSRYQSLLKEIPSQYPRETLHPNQLTQSFLNYNLDSTLLLMNLKSYLTKNQWYWLYYCIIQDMTHKELALKKQTTIDAVKSWGKQARKKLRTPEIKKLLVNE